MCVSFWFLVIFSHVNQWQSVKWANKYKILILNSHFRLRKLRLSYQGTKNVAIYAFSSGKILDVRKIAGVKNMTNIMSDHITLKRSITRDTLPISCSNVLGISLVSFLGSCTQKLSSIFCSQRFIRVFPLFLTTSPTKILLQGWKYFW